MTSPLGLHNSPLMCDLLIIMRVATLNVQNLGLLKADGSSMEHGILMIQKMALRIYWKAPLWSKCLTLDTDRYLSAPTKD